MSVTSPAPETDPRQSAIPDTHGHAKGEHKPYAEERPIPYSARMLFLWFYHACRRGFPRYLMVADHMNSLTFEDPAAVHAVRRAIKHAEAGDLYGAAEIANVEVGHAAVVHEGITRRGMRYSIGAEVDNDPRSRPDAQNIVDAMKPDAMIRSVHFLTIPHPQTGAEYQWPFDNPEFAATYDALGTERVWELYMEQLLDAIEKLPGNIIGHFYVPAKFGHWPSDERLEAHEDRFIQACAQFGKAIELNTRFFYRYATDEESVERYRRANLRLLRKAKAADVGIAVGSDAHSPKDQGRSFEEALSLLDEAEINELVFPIAGRLRQVALRATRELIEEPPVVIEPPPPEIAVKAAETPARSTSAAGEGGETLPARPKRATSKRPADSSSKRTTPSPAKSDGRASAPDAESHAPAVAEPAEIPTPPPLESVDLAIIDAAPETLASSTPSEEASIVPKRAPKSRAKTAPSNGAASESVAIEPAPAEAAPAEPAPAKTAPPKAATAKATPGKPAATVEAAPVKAASAKVAPGKSVPAKAAPLKRVPAKAAAVKSPVKAASTKAAPAAKPAPAKPAAAKATTAKAPPAKGKASPVKAAASKSKATPAKAASSKTPAKAATAAKAPAAKRPPQKAATAKAPRAKSPAARKAAPAKRAAAAKPVAKKPVTKPALKSGAPKAKAAPARSVAKKKTAAKKKTTAKTRR